MKDLKSVVAPFQHQPKELLQYLCKYAIDPILERIANADYGQDADAYLKELKRIKQHKEIQRMPFGIALSEVVELTRWRNPKQVQDNRITEAQRENIAIAFSCTILLSVYHGWYRHRTSEGSTVISLIQACEYLENVLSGTLQKASQLLAWRVTENATDSEEMPFFVLGLILTLLKSRNYEEHQLVDLIDQLLIAEQKAYEKISKWIPETSSYWLFRITHFDQSQQRWQSYQPFLEEQVHEVRSERLKDRLAQLASLLK